MLMKFQPVTDYLHTVLSDLSAPFHTDHMSATVLDLYALSTVTQDFYVNYSIISNGNTVTASDSTTTTVMFSI